MVASEVSPKPPVPPMLVLDNSVTLAWFLREDRTAEARSLLDGLEGAVVVVPALWWTELANGLVISRRRARLAEAQIAAALNLVAALTVDTDPPGPDTLTRLLSVADDHDLTAYDAAYLELAVRRELPLATFDTALWEAARRAGVHLITGINTP